MTATDDTKLNQPAVPAPCPPWCIERELHLEEAQPESVRHVGQPLALEVPADPEFPNNIHHVLHAQLDAYVAEDWGPTNPGVWVQPNPDHGDGVRLDSEGLRELARRLHAHADALAELARQLESLEAKPVR